MSKTIATPTMPERIRMTKVMRTMMVVSLRSLCLKLLCELSCKTHAPKMPHVKKHSLAAQIHDYKNMDSFFNEGKPLGRNWSSLVERKSSATKHSLLQSFVL